MIRTPLDLVTFTQFYLEACDVKNKEIKKEFNSYFDTYFRIFPLKNQ